MTKVRSEVFISYSHKDRKWLDMLQKNLKPLIRGGELKLWDDTRIKAGSQWTEEIENALATAKAAVLLVSPDFLASDFISAHELPRLLEAAKDEGLKILWLAVRSSMYQNTEIQRYQALNDPGTPLDGLSTPRREKELVKICQRIQQECASEHERGSTLARELAPAPPEALARPTKRGLLVGIGTYQQASKLSELVAPKNNVKDLMGALTKPAECEFDVKPLVNPEANELKRELLQLTKVAGPADLVLFYYAGHAKVSTEDGVCLCTTDTDLDLLDSTSVPLKWLKEKISDKIQAAHVVILLDCCYSPAEGSAAVDIPKALQNDLGKGKGKYVITSSTHMHESIDSPGEGNSVFTKWLVKGLETWAADRGRDGIITLDELYQYADENTRGESQRLPEKWEFEAEGAGGVEMARKSQASGATIPLENLGPEFEYRLRMVRLGFSQKKMIPFLGDGIYGSGPLSSFELVGALAERGDFNADQRPTLATAAEYFEQINTWANSNEDKEEQYAGRWEFLAQFRDILEKQSQQLKPQRKTAHDLILGMATPWLVVSATYDLILEQRLEDKGIPYVLVAHILRSSEAKDEGKILLVRHGEQTPKICSADGFSLEEFADAHGNYRVIYKVLGSPFLHDAVDSSLIDTVVVTETDHMSFLARLENEQTRVPTAFTKAFRRGSWLFLGYSLDVWHYRLIARVFSKTGFARTSGNAFAVRVPTSDMEERFWTRVDANLLRSDAETFSKVLLSKRSAAR